MIPERKVDANDPQQLIGRMYFDPIKNEYITVHDMKGAVWVYTRVVGTSIVGWMLRSALENQYEPVVPEIAVKKTPSAGIF